jgi:rRNA maturation RNase YbeY
MIEFYSENEFALTDAAAIKEWIGKIVQEHGHKLGEIGFVFCSDTYLLDLNQQYLNHDSLTDIISFDYSLGKEIHGEIYISTERVEENAAIYNTDFSHELHRVMIHGILHLCGLKDKTEEEKERMRDAEDRALSNRSFF